MTIKELELEIRQLRRIEKSIEGGTAGGFSETEILLALLPLIKILIQCRVLHTEELRLRGSIKSAERTEKFANKFIGSFSPARAWIESLKKTCLARIDAQQKIWQTISEMLPWVEPLIRRLNLPPNHILLQTLPKPVAGEVSSSVPMVAEMTEVASESIEEMGA